jgi:myosin heavy subunit
MHALGGIRGRNNRNVSPRTNESGAANGRGTELPHVFFELLSGGMDETELAVYHFDTTTTPTDFCSTSSGTYDRRDEVSDRDTYYTLRQAMTDMRFSAEEQQHIFGLVAAVLHGSNLEFEQDAKDAATLQTEKCKHLDAMCRVDGSHGP